MARSHDGSDGGRIDFFFGPVGLVLPLIRDGKPVPLTLNGPTRLGRAAGRSDHRRPVVDAEYPIWIDICRQVRRAMSWKSCMANDAALKSAVSSKLLALSRSDGDDDIRVRCLCLKESALNAKVVKAIGLKAE